MLRLFAAAAAAILLAALPASADDVKAGDLVLTGLWTRATPPGAPTAGGYLTITNKGTEPDTLTSVASSGAARAELHVMQMKDGVMTMRPVDGGIPIPARGSVALAPSGYHIMFMDLKQPLKQGEMMKGTLTFEKAGTVDVEFKVDSIAAKGGEGAHQGH